MLICFLGDSTLKVVILLFSRFEVISQVDAKTTGIVELVALRADSALVDDKIIPQGAEKYHWRSACNNQFALQKLAVDAGIHRPEIAQLVKLTGLEPDETVEVIWGNRRSGRYGR